MSETLADVINKIDKAHQMVVDLCKPEYSEEHRDWVMSIPARPDYDPDLIIGEALRSARKLILEYAYVTLLDERKVTS